MDFSWHTVERKLTPQLRNCWFLLVSPSFFIPGARRGGNVGETSICLPHPTTPGDTDGMAGCREWMMGVGCFDLKVSWRIVKPNRWKARGVNSEDVGQVWAMEITGGKRVKTWWVSDL